MPPAMTLTQMDTLCLDVDMEGIAPWPEVEDREEIQTGEFFLVTVPLQKEGEEEKHQWVLPAQATRLSDGTLEMKVCLTNVWGRFGLKAITSVKVDADLQIRHVIVEGPDNVKIKDLFDNDVSRVMDETATKLHTDNKFFKHALDVTFCPMLESETAKYPRWDLLKAAISPLMEITVAQWKKLRPKDYKTKENITTAEKTSFVTNYLAPAHEHLKAREEASENAEEKKAIGSVIKSDAKTNVWFMTLLVDLICKQDLPSDDDEPVVLEGHPALQSILKAVNAQNAAIDALKAHVSLMSTQLQLRDAVATTGVKPMILRLDKDHDCTFKLMQAFADKIMDPKAIISMSNDSANIARSMVIFQAQRRWQDNEEGFRDFFEMSFPEYDSLMRKPPSTENWGEYKENVLFCDEHPTLEIRTIVKGVDGKISVHTTDDSGNRVHVGFRIINEMASKGHCDIGATKKNAGATAQYIFSQQEAKQAQQLLSNLLAETRSASLDRPPANAYLSKEQVLKSIKESREAEKVDARQDGAAWTTVANASKDKEKKKAKKKADEAENRQRAREADARKEQQLAEIQAQQAQLLQQQQYLMQGRLPMQTQPPPQQQPPAMAQPQPQPSYGGQSNYQSPTHNHPPTQAPGVNTVQQWNAGAAPQQWPTVAQQQLWSQVAGSKQPQYHPVTSGWPTGISQAQAGAQMNGEPVVPAVVVFNGIAPETLKAVLRQLDPAMATAVVSITQEQGPKGSRAVLHCKASDAPQLQQVLPPLLRQRRLPADSYVARKSQQAVQGMQAASFKAGVCHHFAMRTKCPFEGRCKFMCWPPEGCPP